MTKALGYALLEWSPCQAFPPPASWEFSVASRRARRARADGCAPAIPPSRSRLRHFGRVVHLLWLQITGVFFLFFALAGGLACWREYQAWQAGKIGPGKMVLAACFALVFLWFGVSSFWRAKRKA